jgi:hypothetical protein
VPQQATLATCHAGQMTPLAASSPSQSLVECFGLRPCERRPWLVVTGQRLPAGALGRLRPRQRRERRPVAPPRAGDRIEQVAGEAQLAVGAQRDQAPRRGEHTVTGRCRRGPGARRAVMSGLPLSWWARASRHRSRGGGTSLRRLGCPRRRGSSGRLCSSQGWRRGTLRRRPFHRRGRHDPSAR